MCAYTVTTAVILLKSN